MVSSREETSTVYLLLAGPREIPNVWPCLTSTATSQGSTLQRLPLDQNGVGWGGAHSLLHRLEGPGPVSIRLNCTICPKRMRTSPWMLNADPRTALNSRGHLQFRDVTSPGRLCPRVWSFQAQHGDEPAEPLSPRQPKAIHLGPKQRGGGTGASGPSTPGVGSAGGIPQSKQVAGSGTELRNFSKRKRTAEFWVKRVSARSSDRMEAEPSRRLLTPDCS